MSKYRLIHDVWHAYSYGDKIKVVYVKASARRISKQETLFSELEGLPEGLKADAIRSTVYGGNVVALSSEGDFPEAPRRGSSAEGKDTEERFQASISRTKNRIFELAMCNEFTMFCTLTQDEKKVRNRYDLETFRKDFAHFVRNQNRSRELPIKYLLIPEQHKDGAWHIHGFFSGLEEGTDLTAFTLADRLPYRLRKMIKNGETVYNWPKYAKKYGFFTATAIKDKIAASSYITKYVTKDVAKQALESGRHLFFASQGLKGREVVVHDNIDQGGELVFCPISDGEWDFENDYVKVKWIDRNYGIT